MNGTTPFSLIESSNVLLEARNVRRTYGGAKLAGLIPLGRPVHALNGVSVKVRRGEVYGIVGETGCGKSTLARCITMLEAPDAGEVLFEGTDVRTLNAEGRRRFHAQVQMVFQDPQSSLNRSQTIGATLTSPLRIHGLFSSREEERRRIRELLEMVGLQASFADRYPHHLSGGQRQRVGIARALAVEPKLVVLDEPTSSLDVAVQAQIVNLLLDLQSRLDLTYVLISHDLALVRYFCDRIGVMYLGNLVEEGPAEDVWNDPRHPYARALIDAAPQIGKPFPSSHTLRHELPVAAGRTEGCPFHPRCASAMPECRRSAPPAVPVSSHRFAACNLAKIVPGDIRGGEVLIRKLKEGPIQ